MDELRQEWEGKGRRDRMVWSKGMGRESLPPISTSIISGP
jgi:hypothetical protein